MPLSKQQTDTEQSQSGLVIAYFGHSVAVEASDGQAFQCHLRRNQPLPVVGDVVRWQPLKAETGVGTVLAIEPRRSTLVRGDLQGGQVKPLAANVDVMVIVMVPPPIFSTYLVDRYLVAAALLGITPLLVLNKIDLLDDNLVSQAEACLRPYREAAYRVLTTSVITNQGLGALAAALSHQTAVFLGPSGVGKSSMIAALVGNDQIKIGETSDKGTGKHTTTATRLYHLREGGDVIDSPGVREFNLWPVTQADLWRGFRELAAFSGSCRFRDCRHDKEPGCAVHEAVKDGKLPAARLASYHQLLKEFASRSPTTDRGKPNK